MKYYKQKSSFEGELVKYYEVFFDIKNKAQKQTEYICSLLEDSTKKYNKIWDIGCGTGRHAELMADCLGGGIY